MAVCLQAQLTRVGQPTVLPLGLGLQNQVIGATLQTAGHVPAEGDLLACQIVLCGMVDIHAGHVRTFGRLEMVDGGLDPI